MVGSSDTNFDNMTKNVATYKLSTSMKRNCHGLIAIHRSVTYKCVSKIKYAFHHKHECVRSRSASVHASSYK